MIPDTRRDARTEGSVYDCTSRRVRSLEGDGRAAEPEGRVVSRAQPDRMLIGVRPVVPIDPEGDRPLSAPAYGDEGGNLVRGSIELPRTTNFPDDVRRARDRSEERRVGKEFRLRVWGERLHD